MSWTLVEKPKTVRVTRSLAQTWVDLDAAPHDRTLSQRRMEVYEKMFKEGTFRPVTWAKCTCHETGSVYRLNGKHTSTLLSKINPLPEFWVTIEEYEADTLHDVAKLYATFDSKTQLRTARDIYLSFAGTVSDFADISGQNLCIAVAGMSWHKWSGHLSNTQPTERAELLLENQEFVCWLAPMMSDSSLTHGHLTRRGANHLFRAPVVAAMFACYLKDRDDATKFWELVRDESAPVPTTPDRKLARWLHKTKSNTGGGARWGTEHASSREIYCKCLHGWNAWRNKESTNLNYYRDKPIPEAV